MDIDLPSLSDSDLYDLMIEVRQAEASLGGASFSEELVQEADTRNEPALSMMARVALIYHAGLSGAQDRALVAFTWNLKVLEENEELEEMFGHEVDWTFKWIVEDAPKFPGISREQIDSLIGQMQKRYEAQQHSLRPVEHLRGTVALMMGDAQTARKHYEAARKLPDDGLSDCEACLVHADADLELASGDLPAALKVGEDVLNQKVTCHSKPMDTYAHFLLPLAAFEKWEQAVGYYTYLREELPERDGQAGNVGRMLAFLVAARQMDEAVSLLESQWLEGLTAGAPLDRLTFLMGVLQVLYGLASDDQSATLHLEPPESVPMEPDAEGRFSVMELGPCIAGAVMSDIEEFDKRNGNDVYQRRHDTWTALCQRGPSSPVSLDA